MSSSRDHRRRLFEQMVGSPVGGDRFVITKLLGFGGMGAVYEAIQTNMNRKVALKLIPTHDPTTVARFEREALTISSLRHPNTITVFDYGQSDGGFLFLSMELLDGRTLSDVIEEDGPLEPERAVHIASQICRSLNEAHHSGIVHRDIKPDNIILIQVDSDPDVVKVLDFGIAKAVMGEDDVQLTGDGRIIGTPRYMSPEQILAEPLDHRSDIYSLGCILFEMLCGAPPFRQSSTTALMISHTQDNPPPFAQRLEAAHMFHMPSYLEHVVRRALAKAPNDRHQTTNEFRVELERALASAPVGNIEPDVTAASLPIHVSQNMAHPSLTGTRAPGNLAHPPQQAQLNVGATMAAYDVSESPGVPKLLIAGIGVLFLAVIVVGGYALTRQEVEAPAEKDPKVATIAPKNEEIKEIKKSAPATVKPKPKPKATATLVSVQFSTTPPGAEIFREGKSTGKKTPTTLVLKSGEIFDYSFEKKGFLSYGAQIVPEKGAVVDVALQRRVKKRGTPVKTQITSTKPKEEEMVVPMIGDEENTTVEMLD